ncbi:MAG TPA: DUF1707 domain-containing protein [Micromonosporaceae bacterium]|nr:DUF1707 domain-containing protein [Micromonosporaceae bacterium]
MTVEPAPPVRASDVEREKVIATLTEHATQGRLTFAELEERMARVYQAKTLAELEPLISDLPASPVTAARGTPVQRLVAVLSGFSKLGRWRAAPTVNVVGVMGGGEIDLRGAEFTGDGLTLKVTAIMGGFEIYVPDSIEVEVEGFSLLGGHETRGSRRAPRPGAPLVRIQVFALMGGVEVWRVPADLQTTSLKKLRRAAKQLEG